MGLFVVLAIVSLPLFIDSASITLPELKSVVIGEKVTEGFSLYSEIIDSTPPLGSWFYGVCDFIFGRGLTGRHIATFIILFLQSAFFGIILIDKRAFAENTFIPTLIFSLLTLFSFDLLSLTVDIAAFGFLLLALNALLTEIEFRVQRDETIFNLGLFVSLATLFNFSYIIYLPGFLLILIIFTRNSVRKYLLMLTGFSLPLVLLFCLYYLRGEGDALLYRFFVPNLSFINNSLGTTKSLLVLGAVPLYYLFLSLFVLNRNAHLTKYQSQVLQTMFLWLLIALIQIYFAPDLRPQSLLPLLPPVSFFLTHFLLVLRRKKFAEIHAWIFFIGIVGTTYLARYQKVIPVDYSNLTVKIPSQEILNKKILVLDDSPGMLIKNTLSPPFIDWELTRAIFDNPGYYENVLLVNRQFERDHPELIVDPENRMEKFFERIPKLKSQYQKLDNGNWVLINN